jgi:DNA polymerase III delta prime subunit
MKIKSIKSIGIQPVYDVTTYSENKNFILNSGVVAHNCSSTQPAFRGLLEEFSSNVTFIATANFKNRIIEPLLSRFAVFDFEFTKEEKANLLIQFNKRVKHILEDNNIEYDKKALANLLVKYFPDFRKILNELQRNCQTGSLSTTLTSNNEIVLELISFLKQKDFTSMRKWVAVNSDMDYSILQRSLYDKAYELLQPSSIPQLVLHLAEYDYKNAFVIDKEINVVACMLSIMSDCEFL